MSFVLLLVDHDDSFTHNLKSYFLSQGIPVLHRQSSASLLDLLQESVQGIVFSPGPGHPRDYPASVEFYKKIPNSIPVLGVCLGHQLMLYAHGAEVRQISHCPVHGRQVIMERRAPSRFVPHDSFLSPVVLYNSWGVFEDESVFLDTFVCVAVESQVCVMAEHKTLPRVGLQFHPESFASPRGIDYLNSFLRFVSC
jgi:anthranilate synthase component 2